MVSINTHLQSKGPYLFIFKLDQFKNGNLGFGFLHGGYVLGFFF